MNMTLTNLQRDRGMCISFFEPAGVASTSLKISVLYVAKLNLLNGAVECLYVCMYLCMYVCIYLCMYVGMYVCMYVFMYVFMYVCIYVCMYVFSVEGLEDI